MQQSAFCPSSNILLVFKNLLNNFSQPRVMPFPIFIFLVSSFLEKPYAPNFYNYLQDSSKLSTLHDFDK